MQPVGFVPQAAARFSDCFFRHSGYGVAKRAEAALLQKNGVNGNLSQLRIPCPLKRQTDPPAGWFPGTGGYVRQKPAIDPAQSSP